jgi:general secretion pathway protein F
VARLQRDGNLPTLVESDSGGGSRSFWHLGAGAGVALRPQEIAEITRELAIMLGAGQDIDHALGFLVETTGSRRVRAVVGKIRDAVRDGSPLAAALEREPASFTRLYVGMVRAGEAGGALAATLDRLATLLEQQRRLAATVTSAMIYPTLLVVGAIGSITLLLTEVLPQFVPLFEQNGAKLPAATQMLIDFGGFVSAYGLAILLGVILAVVAFRGLLRLPGPRLAVDRLVLRLPVAGRLIRETLAARFTRTLGTLLLNGMPLIGALGIVRDVLGNSAAVLAVDHATVSAKGGRGLAGPLEAERLFPLRTVYLLRLGEETAQLGGMALRAAEIHEENTRLGIQRLLALLVPAITIVMGAAIAGIVASLLLAMLSLNDLAQ